MWKYACPAVYWLCRSSQGGAHSCDINTCIYSFILSPFLIHEIDFGILRRFQCDGGSSQYSLFVCAYVGVCVCVYVDMCMHVYVRICMLLHLALHGF